jgi:hypothetical protein
MFTACEFDKQPPLEISLLDVEGQLIDARFFHQDDEGNRFCFVDEKEFDRLGDCIQAEYDDCVYEVPVEFVLNKRGESASEDQVFKKCILTFGKESFNVFIYPFLSTQFSINSVSYPIVFVNNGKYFLWIFYSQEFVGEAVRDYTMMIVSNEMLVKGEPPVMYNFKSSNTWFGSAACFDGNNIFIGNISATFRSFGTVFAFTFNEEQKKVSVKSIIGNSKNGSLFGQSLYVKDDVLFVAEREFASSNSIIYKFDKVSGTLIGDPHEIEGYSIYNSPVIDGSVLVYPAGNSSYEKGLLFYNIDSGEYQFQKVDAAFFGKDSICASVKGGDGVYYLPGENETHDNCLVRVRKKWDDKAEISLMKVNNAEIFLIYDNYTVDSDKRLYVSCNDLEVDDKAYIYTQDKDVESINLLDSGIFSSIGKENCLFSAVSVTDDCLGSVYLREAEADDQYYLGFISAKK